MTEDIPPQVIKETQTLLGKYIKEPPLTDKLLKKPPFRFLQDIVKSVIKETSFLSDVYTTDELSENIKEKDKKIAFLKKLIAATQDATGVTINARPSKIVAGLEPTKTLQLLQAVASGIAFKQSGTAVEPTVNGDKKEKRKSKDNSKDGSKKSTKKKETVEIAKESKQKKVGENKKDVKEAKNEQVGESEKEEKNEEIVKRRKKSAQETKKLEDVDRNEEKNVVDDQLVLEANSSEKKREDSARKSSQRPQSRRRNDDSTELQNGSARQTLSTEEPQNILPESLSNGDATAGAAPKILEETVQNTDATNEINVRKAGVETPKEKPDKENRGKTEKKEKSKEGNGVERKTSSRRHSSKVRTSAKDGQKDEKAISEKNKVAEPTVLGSGDTIVPTTKVERPQTARKPPPSARPQSSRAVRPPSARPGAPKIRDRGEVKADTVEVENEIKIVPVISDADQTQDDENTVTVERQLISSDLETQGLNFVEINKVGENEGALVAQILEIKKEQEETGLIIGGELNEKPVEIEWEGGKKRKKEAWGKEINRIREGIQRLTKSTNPLGKLFDFLQEDVDSMQRELKMWKETNVNYSRQLREERKLTDESLEKYRKQLSELDGLIVQETETLKNMKANVLANDRKIYSIITKTSISQ